MPGQPTFEPSKRYVLIAHRGLGTPDDMFLPIVGMHGGFFAVEPDTRTGIVSVHDWMHRPLVSVSDDQVVVESDQVDSAEVQTPLRDGGAVVTVGRGMGQDKRVSEKDFIALLRRLAKGK